MKLDVHDCSLQDCRPARFAKCLCCSGLLDSPPEKETTISTSANANKVKLANLAGDKAIVAVILNNSNDSVAAFDAISKRSEFPKQTTSLAAKLLPEAQEQRSFLEKFVES